MRLHGIRSYLETSPSNVLLYVRAEHCPTLLKRCLSITMIDLLRNVVDGTFYRGMALFKLEKEKNHWSKFFLQSLLVKIEFWEHLICICICIYSIWYIYWYNSVVICEYFVVNIRQALFRRKDRTLFCLARLLQLRPGFPIDHRYVSFHLWPTHNEIQHNFVSVNQNSFYEFHVFSEEKHFQLNRISLYWTSFILIVDSSWNLVFVLPAEKDTKDSSRKIVCNGSPAEVWALDVIFEVGRLGRLPKMNGFVSFALHEYWVSK